MQPRSAYRQDDGVGDWRGEAPTWLRQWDMAVSDPPNIDDATYDRARESFVAATADHSDVVAVFGDSATPSVPGVSDLDLALVVTDQIEEFAELQASVGSVLEEFSVVFSHNPIIIPESIFERLSLLANSPLSFDHLAGRTFDPIEPDEVAWTLRFFDRLAYMPYGYLVRDLYPSPERNGRSRVPAPLARLFETTAEPLVAAASGYRPPAGTLRVKKGRILSTVASLRHDREHFTRAIGRSPTATGDVLERVQHYRHTCLDDPPTAEECLALLIDGLWYSYHLHQEFIDRQTVYPAHDRPYYLRRELPTVATPAWDALTPPQMVQLFYNSGMPGRVLPPEAALHTALLPRGDDLFYASPPAVEPDAMRTIETRNEAIRQYLAFLDAHADQDGFFETFKLIPVVELLQDARAGATSRTATPARVKRHVRDMRNLMVEKLWHRSITA